MFIPRHPVIENQFCSYAETDTSGGIGGVVAYAGTVVYLDSSIVTNPNNDALVKKMVHVDSNPPASFGFLMQKVKTGYHQVHPTGYYMPGDLGSSDVIAQPKYGSTGAITGTKAAPVGVAHLGIWDTVHYTCEKTKSGTDPSVITDANRMIPGAPLYPAADEGRVTNSVIPSDGTNDADTGDCVKGLQTSAVAKVVKGASAAKCQANVDNVTLYPIRIKLLV